MSCPFPPPDDHETLDSLLHALTRAEERRLNAALRPPEDEEAPEEELDRSWPPRPLPRVAAPIRG